MKLVHSLAIEVCISLGGATWSVSAANWKIAGAPLLTPWAEKVDPKNPLPEYPRPMMERKDWLSLNGVWEFQQAQVSDAVPLGKKLDGVIPVPFRRFSFSNRHLYHDRKVEKLEKQRVCRANVELWQPVAQEVNVVNPSDGGAPATPDELRNARKRK